MLYYVVVPYCIRFHAWGESKHFVRASTRVRRDVWRIVVIRRCLMTLMSLMYTASVCVHAHSVSICAFPCTCLYHNVCYHPSYQQALGLTHDECDPECLRCTFQYPCYGTRAHTQIHALCCTMLYYVILFCNMLYCVVCVLCCTIVYYVVLLLYSCVLCCLSLIHIWRCRRAI